MTAGVLLCVEASGASAVEKGIWGGLTLNDHTTPAMTVYQKLGVQELQVQLRWSDIAAGNTRPTGNLRDPLNPAYNWNNASGKMVTQAIAEAAPLGIHVAVMIKGTPRWANGGQNLDWAPNDPNDAADFAYAASKEFPTVRNWMIWGEANGGAGFLPMPQPPDDPTGTIGPQRYGELLDAMYGALKEADPDNNVIGGMTYTFGAVPPAIFLRELRLPNGKMPRLDMWGHNPFSHRSLTLTQCVNAYPYQDSRDFADMGRFESELQAEYGRQIPLWLSEFTVSSDRPNRAFKYYLSRDLQAQRLSQAYWIASKQPWIAMLGWFNLQDEDTSLVPNGLTTGLLDEAGNPKPAFNAYKNAPQPTQLDPAATCDPLPPAPDDPPAAPAQPAPPGINALRLVLKANKQKRARVLKRGVRIRVRCSTGHCNVMIHLYGRGVGKRKKHKITLATRKIRVGQKRRVIMLKLTRRGRKALKTKHVRGVKVAGRGTAIGWKPNKKTISIRIVR